MRTPATVMQLFEMLIQWCQIPWLWETLCPFPISAGNHRIVGKGKRTVPFYLGTSGLDFWLVQNSLPPTFHLLFALHSISILIYNKAPFPQPPKTLLTKTAGNRWRLSAQDLEAAMGCYLTEEHRGEFTTEWQIPPSHYIFHLQPFWGPCLSPLFLSLANTSNPSNSHSFLMLC